MRHGYEASNPSRSIPRREQGEFSDSSSGRGIDFLKAVGNEARYVSGAAREETPTLHFET